MGGTQGQSSVADTSSRGEIERLADRLAWCEKDILRKDATLARKEAQLADLSRRLTAVVSADNARQVHFDNTQRMNETLRRQRDNLHNQLIEIHESRSWRLLTALRKLRLRVLGSSASR